MKTLDEMSDTNVHEAANRIEELEGEVQELTCLLSKWYEAWNDGYEPDGDMLHDTIAALAWLEEQD